MLRNPLSVFLVFLRLGLTSFGGPVAHLGYFREEFVARRQWLSERHFADLISLCQFLPGPASSQVGLSIGLFRAGYWGAIVAWAGFTLPSAAILILFALGIANYGDLVPAGVLAGLKIVAVAVVAHAVWNMAQKLCAGVWQVSIMTASACTVLALPTALGQILVILGGAISGMLLFSPEPRDDQEVSPLAIGRRSAVVALITFFALLFGLPVLAELVSGKTVTFVDAFYRSGSLVFGGGHVVLPLLQAEVVPSGWVSHEAFLAGYGAAQAVPGPLFTFSAFLGASMEIGPTGIWGGVLCLISIYIPSFLLIIGALPFWDRLRRNARVQTALTGINASVVGLLLAALYTPVWTSAIHSSMDFVLGLVAFVALRFWRQPPWLVVIATGLVCWLLSL